MSDPNPAAPQSLNDGVPDDAVELLRRMWEIRHFENEVMSLFSQNLVRGSTHLCQGQEAVSVGVCWDLRHTDFMTCTYRGHGAVLAKGAPLDGSFGEILGRQIGLCGGKGGSMHLADISVGALGSNAIVGAHLPISVGSALSSQVKGRDDVSVAIFGDGSTNIGAFHESLNMASIWKLPVVFVIENNQYGEYSPLAATTPISQLSQRADSYGMPSRSVDGNDVVAVRAAMNDAVAHARQGLGPTLIEASTYRQVGHSRERSGRLPTRRRTSSSAGWPRTRFLGFPTPWCPTGSRATRSTQSKHQLAPLLTGARESSGLTDSRR